jgi:hypothetical protein
MKIEIINQKALESLLSEPEVPSETGGAGANGMLACDGCSCDTGSDWVNQVCPSPEWVVSWKKATC